MTDNIAQLQQLLLSDPQIQRVMRPLQLGAGQMLFHRGDPGDALYLVKQGTLRVYTLDPQGQEMTLNRISTGGCVGELAPIDALPRSASVVAVEDTHLLRLSREDFLQQVHRSPALNQRVIGLLTERVRYMTEYVERLGQWARLIADEDYSSMSDSLAEIDLGGDPVLIAVADSVRLMVKAIQQRERQLQEALVRLQIEIDEERRKRAVEEITETDYFQSLLQQSRQRRESRAQRKAGQV